MKKRSDGRYMKYVPVGGKRIAFYSSIGLTEKEAEDEILQKILEYNIKDFHKKHNFGCIADQLLRKKEKQVSYSTWDCYETAAKKLEVFYTRDIESITPIELQNLLDSLADRGYSKSAISKVKIVYGLIVKHAIFNGVDVRNYSDVLKIPKNASSGRRHSVPDAVVQLINEHAMDTEFGMWAFIMCYTGLRRGELAALRRSNIDLERKLIFVNNSVEFIGNKPVVKDMPKSISGIRQVPLLDVLYDKIAEYVKGMKPTDFIFGGEKPLTETMIKKRWKKYCNTIGVDMNQHQLRHTYAKMLYRAGVDAKTAQGLLGHADITTTMNIYTDFSKDVTDKAVISINDFLRKTS